MNKKKFSKHLDLSNYTTIKVGGIAEYFAEPSNIDEFIDLDKLKIGDVESFIRKKNLDIAVNLNGYTSNSKNEIFSKGIARFQINYLGYPGTMGTDAMDYLIADKIVIPENNKKYFTEKILYLPNCWLPSSKHREISLLFGVLFPGGLQYKIFVR